MRGRRPYSTIAIASAIQLAQACGSVAVPDDSGATEPDAGRPDICLTAYEVDVLLMIDSSDSMGAEQAALVAELPRMVRVLTSGDLEGDGRPDFPASGLLHIGVITSDMGAGGHPVPSCEDGIGGSALGDDGLLITLDTTPTTGCTPTYPAFFGFAGSGDHDDAAADLVCAASVGLGGCGFEQPLDAVLKALSPSEPGGYTVAGYVPPVFVDGTLGHGDRENAGFLRSDSVLAIIVLSDENDCSARDTDLFDPESVVYGDAPLDLRCFTHVEALHPIERYVRGVDPPGAGGLLGLRHTPRRIVFAPIVGVPPSAIADPFDVDIDAVLAHPDMEERIDPTVPRRIRPSCNVLRVGIAMPPTRIVRVAQAIVAAGGRATVQSICQPSYATPIDAIIAQIADALRNICRE
jgi:hypothetical protein